MKFENLELIAIHIKKTGGMSFKNLLKKQYGKDYFRLNYPPPKSKNQAAVFEKRILKAAPSIRVIHGHFSYRTVSGIVEANPGVEIVTWLREPIQRLISRYYYSKRKFSEGLRPNNPELAEISLIEFVNMPEQINSLSYMVDGIDLSEMKFIGLLEHMEKDLNYLTEVFNWTSIPMPKKNTNTQFKSNYPPPSEEEIEEIKRLNYQDIELYKYCLELREKRVRDGR